MLWGPGAVLGPSHESDMLGSSNRKKKKQRKLLSRLQKHASEPSSAKDTGGDSNDSEGNDDRADSMGIVLNDLGFDETQLGFTAEDLFGCMQVLRGLGSNLHAFKSQPFRDLRGALHPLIEEQVKNYDVKGMAGKRRRGNRGCDVEQPNLKELDKAWINKTALRAKRLQALEELNTATGPINGRDNQILLLTHKGEVEEAVAKLREQQGLVHRVPDGVAELGEEEEAAARGQTMRLNIPVACYICKRPFVDLHFFYCQLCPTCAELNYRKRNEKVDMAGCVAIVTGGRVKIGYRCALKLLRCGCIVIVTSRFATDCARRFAKEADSDEWIGNLQCYGIDFRDLQSLELFCDWVKNRHSRLDAVVNNACQTIRRPAQYYSHLMNAECTPLAELSPKERGLLQGNEEFRSKIGVRYLEVQQDSLLPGVSGAGSARGKASIQTIEELEEGVSAAPSTTEASQRDVVSGAAGGAAAGADGGQECNKTAVRARGEGGNKGLQDAQVELGVGSGSAKEPGVSVVNADSLGQGSTLRVGTAAEMSQRHVLQEDAHRCTEAFPSRAGGGAVLDINEQQLDLRTNNSWMLKLHEVSTGELAEVMVINSIAPAIINARLKPLLAASPAKYKFVVNVSAMEGKFYRWKSDHHPHTNMAKAALNMMTRTSAQDYVKSGIYMTAVDTGWINDEKPMEQAVSHEETHNFQTPLDEIDAAARVLDPIIAPLLSASEGEDVEPLYGVFLKDFVKCEW